MTEPWPDGLHFSVSQMKAWLMCPRKYEYRYVLGVEPEFVPMPLAFGIEFHAALAHHDGWQKLGEGAPAEEVRQRFIESLTAIRDGGVPLQKDDADADAFETALEKGRQMLGVALTHPSALAKVLAVEQSFIVDLHHPDTGGAAGGATARSDRPHH